MSFYPKVVQVVSGELRGALRLHTGSDETLNRRGIARDFAPHLRTAVRVRRSPLNAIYDDAADGLSFVDNICKLGDPDVSCCCSHPMANKATITA